MFCHVNYDIFYNYCLEGLRNPLKVTFYLCPENLVFKRIIKYSSSAHTRFEAEYRINKFSYHL